MRRVAVRIYESLQEVGYRWEIALDDCNIVGKRTHDTEEDAKGAAVDAVGTLWRVKCAVALIDFEYQTDLKRK